MSGFEVCDPFSSGLRGLNGGKMIFVPHKQKMNCHHKAKHGGEEKVWDLNL